jgi:hypothetical protein
MVRDTREDSRAALEGIVMHNLRIAKREDGHNECVRVDGDSVSGFVSAIVTVN